MNRAIHHVTGASIGSDLATARSSRHPRDLSDRFERKKTVRAGCGLAALTYVSMEHHAEQHPS